MSPPQFFDFHTTKLEQTLVLPSSVASMMLHRDSGLLAVVCDDMRVRIVDIETKKVVRDLGGFRGRVLDIVYSNFTAFKSSFTSNERFQLTGFLSRLSMVSRKLLGFNNSDFRSPVWVPYRRFPDLKCCHQYRFLTHKRLSCDRSCG
jgi:hypothetical protein